MFNNIKIMRILAILKSHCNSFFNMTFYKENFFSLFFSLALTQVIFFPLWQINMLLELGLINFEILILKYSFEFHAPVYLIQWSLTEKNVFEEAVFNFEMRNIILFLVEHGLFNLRSILKGYFADCSLNIL